MRDVSPQRVAAEKPAPLQGSYPWHLRSGKGCRQALALLAILGSVTSLLSRWRGRAVGELGGGSNAEITWLNPVLDFVDNTNARPI